MAVSFIGLGSNMDQPEQHIRKALREVAELEGTEMLAQSSLYLSKPVGPQDQDDFINAVAKLETGLSPLALLDALQAIENEHGRRRIRHWGPRTLDLDLLAYDDECIESERLSVPHPQLQYRSFVLLPWLEIEADWVLPKLGSIRALLENLDGQMPEKLP